MKASQIIAVIVIIIIVAAVGYYAYSTLSATTTPTTSTTSSTSTTSTTSTSSTSSTTSTTSSTTSTTSPTTTSTTSAALGANITVAMTVSQAGSYAPLDSGYLYLNQAWQAWVNSKGGLVDKDGQHHLVKVITQDDQSDPAKAVTAYHQFAEQLGANILVSPYSADTGIQLLPIAEQDHTPIIMAEASTAQMWNGSYHWAVTSMVPYWAFDTTNAWSASYFRLLNQTQWAHSIALVGWQITWAIDDYTSAYYLANHTTGLSVVYHQLLTPQFQNPDFSQQISALKAANPDIVYLAMFGPFCAMFIDQANAAGFHPKEWHTIEWGASFAGILASAGVSKENITSDAFWTPSYPSTNVGTADFLQVMSNANQLAVKANTTGSVQPVTWYNYQNIELRWIIFQMIAQAVSQVPSANFSTAAQENAALNNVLHHLNMQTISGPLVIQPQGYGTIGLATVQFQKGNIETVYPPNVANATYAHP